MQLSVRGFLFARFLAILGWILILAAGFLTYTAVAPHLGSDFLRWVWNLAVLAGTIGLGFTLQRRALHRLDPHGELRRQVRDLTDAKLGVDE